MRAKAFAIFAKNVAEHAQHAQPWPIRLMNSSACSRQSLYDASTSQRFSSTFASSTRQKTGYQEAKGWIRIAKQLSKARLSALVVCTTGVGYIAGSGENVDWKQLGWTAVGTFGASACANTLNQVYEVVNDSRMKRTMMRPLPLGRVSRLQALGFATVMGVGGLAILTEKANGLTAGLGLANILLYAGVYTPMKVISASNTWVGAVVGGIPPLMGWSAASGTLEPGAAVLAAALYFWQIPHFLSLAWLHREDYMRGGYAMLSRFDSNGRRTASCALRNSLYMLPIGVFAAWVGTASWPFAYEAAIGAGALATTAAIFYQRPSPKSARMLFRFSIAFIPAFMLGLVIHRVPNDHTVTFSTLQEKLKAGVGIHEKQELLEMNNGEGSSAKYPAIPIPFLPTPLQYRCPSKIACEGNVSGLDMPPPDHKNA